MHHYIKAPLLFKELFSGHVFPKFSSQRTDWDNLSDEVTYYQAPQEEELEQEEKETGNEEAEPRFWPVTPNANAYDHGAVDACARACDKTPSCFQYLWDGGSCKLSPQFTLGGMKQVEDKRRCVSGWDLKRVRKFQTENECGSGLWEYHE